MPVIAITADRGVPKKVLDKLAAETSLPLLSPSLHADYRLHIKTDYLECQKVTPLKKKLKIDSIHIDFVGGKLNHRRLHGGGKGQDIAKAIGLHKISNPAVLDLTAGMGGDAFVLASLGANVTMIERNPVVFALLKDALERLSMNADNELQAIHQRLTLHKQNAIVFLEKLNKNNLPDVIYLDPMFPERNKSAQVKKEMQFFHDIVGSDADAEKLFLAALPHANKRIVVKRPRLAPPLSDTVKSDFSITGKSTRYDIYLPKHHI